MTSTPEETLPENMLPPEIVQYVALNDSLLVQQWKLSLAVGKLMEIKALVDGLEVSKPTLGGDVRSLLQRLGLRARMQNLNTRYVDHREIVKGPAWIAGRAWFTLRTWEDQGNSPTLRVEWKVGASDTLGFSLATERYGDDDFLLSLWPPFLHLYFSTDNLFPAWLKERLPKEYTNLIKLQWHDGALHWQFYQNDNEWRSTDPWWHRGHFDPLNFLFGNMSFSRVELAKTEALVPMPEGLYPVTIKLQQHTWRRAKAVKGVWYAQLAETLWHRHPLFHSCPAAEINCEPGIPYPGKGENSWDCGEDATYGMTVRDVSSYSEAAGRLITSVLRDRERYGGLDWRPRKPAPIAPVS